MQPGITMELELDQVAPDVFHVEASHTNFVVVRDGDDVMLVDSGYPRDRELLVRVLDRLGSRPGDLAALLVTHAHVDHLGSAPWLRTEHGVTVRCLDAEAPHVRGEVEEVIGVTDVLLRSWRPSVLGFGLRAIRNGGLSDVSVSDPATFPDGEPLDLPGAPVPVHTPGHTTGHAAFHLPERGVLVSGDALVTVDLWNHERTGPQLIRREFNHDQATAERSLQRFVELEADVLVPGHGTPWFGTPADAVDLARAR